MSNVGDALSTGSTDGTGITDSTLSDASLGDQITGGDGSFGTGDTSAFGSGGFQNFNTLTNLLSGGGVDGAPSGAASAPTAAAPAAGGDPTGAAGGTQSNTTPGSSTPTTNQNQQQQTGQQNQQNPDYAPPQAVDQLKALIKQLNSGKPAGPTGPTPQGAQAQPFALPTLAAGQTGVQSPRMALPQLAAGQTGAQSPGSFLGTSAQPGGDAVGAASGANPADAAIPPGAAQQPTAQAAAETGDGAAGTPATDAQGNPVTAAGTPAAQTPQPPSRPGAAQTAAAGDGGRDITVRKQGAGAQPVATADLPTRVPHPDANLPTHKPGPSPAPPPAQQPADAPVSNIPPSRLIQDITGISTGSPAALADLARAAGMILPLAGMFMGGGRGRRGGFRGGRFTHGVGGFGHLHGGQHPAARGAWPYHHPVHGWHFHGRPPGPGWRPLHPMDAQSIVGGGGSSGGGGASGSWDGQDPSQDPNAPDPNRPPKEGGSSGGSYSDPVGGPWSGNSVYNTLVGAESGGRNDGAPGQPAGGDGGIARGYFNIQTPTWGDFKQNVPGASQYQTADQAPYEIQRAVANTIPVARFGDRTRRILHSKFGEFNERMTVGQLAEQKGGNLSRAARLPPPQIPVTSQPMVAGP